MTHGTIAGMLLTDLIQGRQNRWEDLYSPSRVRLKALPEYAAENFNVAAQYTDYLTGNDKTAVYRDDAGHEHKLSAVCPHLGCLVKWNSTERTWDCPCHGSRFSAEGSV